MSSKRKIRRPRRRSCAVIRRQDADVVDDVVKTKTPHDVDIGRWQTPVSELASGHTSNTVCTMTMFRWCDDNVWGPALAGVLRSIGRGGQPAASSSRAYGRSKIYNNKPWALDWVGGLHRPGCGAVIFLSDDNGATWYCCGGVEKSESARNTYDGRTFRTFFLTSVFDKDGTNWVKEDKKVGLDLRLFQGYGVKAFSMKAFDVCGDGTELRMLTAEQFLSRTNGYRVTGCHPIVESSLELTKPLVKFSSPADQLPGVVKEYREAFSRLPLDQQADCAFVPFVTSSRKSRQTPSAPVGKRKQLAACPAPPLPAASPSPLPTVTGGHDIAQCSSEATEYDDRNLYGRNAARDSAREGATALTERNEEEEDGGSCGLREDDGDDEYMDVGDENMQDQNMLGDDDVGVTSEHGPGDIPTGFTRGYFNVSAFDNTRENRAMMLSFEDVVRDMRQWWIDNHRIEAQKGKILKFDLRKDKLTSKDYAELAKSGDGFNPIDSEEDSSDSDLELGKDTCAEVPRGGMVQDHDDGTVHSHGGSIPVAAPSVASMVAPSKSAALQDIGRCGGNEEDDIEIPGEASTLASGDAIPSGYCADLDTIYFLEGKHTHTGEDQWGHDIIWHEGVLQPCIQDGEWKIAVKYTSGWKTFRWMSKDIWFKTTELAILHRVRVENPLQSEAAIKAKVEELFHVLRDNR
uniref:Uncharacterized protein n=1 Tax=Chara braunii TaxID=69332 RepID=A0A388KFU9_CHABU